MASCNTLLIHPGEALGEQRHRHTDFWNGHRLVWEYPRQTPQGDQVDILEVMDIVEGKITHHRIYWGWFGFELLKQSSLKKAGKRVLQE